MGIIKKSEFNYKVTDAEEERIREEALMNYSCDNLSKTFHGSKTEVEAITTSILPSSFTVRGKDKKKHTVTASLLTLSYNRFARGGVYKIRIVDECGKDMSVITRHEVIYAGRDKHMTYEIIDNIASALVRSAADCVKNLF